MTDDFARTTAERHPDDPHTMTPPKQGPPPLRIWHRYCSCGWNLGSVEREHVMTEARRHRAWVAIVRKRQR